MKLKVSDSTYALTPQVLRRVRREMKRHTARLGKRIAEGPATILVPLSGSGQLSVEYDAGAHLPLGFDVVADKKGKLRLAPGTPWQIALRIVVNAATVTCGLFVLGALAMVFWPA